MLHSWYQRWNIIILKSWVSRTLHKMGFSSRKSKNKKTHQLSSNYLKKIERFQKRVQKYFKSHKNDPNFNIWVMNETGVWDSSSSLSTYTRSSNPKPYIKEKERNNKRDTFQKTLSFRGRKLPLFGIQHTPSKYRTLEVQGEKKGSCSS